MKQLGVALAVIFVLTAGGFAISSLKDYKQAEAKYVNENGIIGDKAEMFENIITDGNEYGMKVNVNEQFSSTTISTVSSEVTVVKGNGDKATVEYINSSKKRHLNVAVRNGTLEVEEKYTFSIFNFDFTKNGKIIVELPEQAYNSIETTTVSGGILVDNLEADNIVLRTTSGTVEADIAADRVTAKSVSGKMKINNIKPENNLTSLNVSTTSGECIINGFASEKTMIKTVSGDVECEGLAGKVDVSTTSGKIELDFAKWNGDLLVKTVSGNVDVDMPENASAAVMTNTVSGKVNYSNIKVGSGVNGMTSIDGTGDQYKISLSTVSGDLNITGK